MLRVMIVDDDYIVREGLRELFNWRELGFELVDDAVDGVDALGKLEASKPDIILSDVVMPRMGGLELISKLNGKNIKTIMISGHDESALIRQAMKYEAVDYVLKPFNFDELTRVLLKLKEHIQQERRDHDRVQLLSEQINKNNYLFFYDDIIPDYHDEQVYIETLSKKTDLLLCFQQENSDAVKMRISDLYKWVKERNINSVLFIISISTDLLLGCMKFLKERKIAITDDWASLHINALGRMRNINDLEEYMNKSLLELCHLRDENTGKHNKLIRQVEEIISEHGTEKGFTISTIAGTLYVSPNYLQSVFKRECGITIKDAITNVRLEHAKKLLTQTDEKIYKISDTVGYADTDHFSNIFKRAVGMSPNEYRERNS